MISMILSPGTPQYQQDLYWQQWLVDATTRYEYYASLTGDRMKYINEAIYNIMKIAIEHKQYLRPDYDAEPVTRMVKIRIPLSRAVVERTFHVETFTIRGSGLYVLMEGIYYTESFRRQSGYGSPDGAFNITTIPQNIKDEYDWRLTTPAMGGLFIPKKTDLTAWLKNTQSIEFFDITL